MNNKRYIICLIAILAFVFTNAKIATWSISPNYQALNRISEDMFLFKENDKYGVITLRDSILLSSDYDFILPFINGYSIFGINRDSKSQLVGIINSSGHVTILKENYILPDSLNFFSEGKLAVMDEKGKFGFIDTIGNTVVRCKFDYALPFNNGYAPVKYEDNMIYIHEKFDTNPSYSTLKVNFHRGKLTNAGRFSEGVAPVRHKNDYALINTKGKKMRKITESEFQEIYDKNSEIPEKDYDFISLPLFKEYLDNGRYGLLEADSIVVIPQFDSFSEIYADGNVLATMNGKMGLLRVAEGNISIATRVGDIHTTELEVNRKGVAQPITFICYVPEALEDFKILIDEGNGQLIDKTSEMIREGNLCTTTVVPILEKKATECKTRVIIEKDGVILADRSQHFSIAKSKTLRMTAPGPSEVRANENDEATVSSTIFNDTGQPINLTVFWSNGTSSYEKIPSRSSKTVKTKFTVKSKYTQEVIVRLSTGKQSKSTITFLPFF